MTKLTRVTLKWIKIKKNVLKIENETFFWNNYKFLA